MINTPFQRSYEPEFYPLSRPMMTRLREVYEIPGSDLPLMSPSLEENLARIKENFAATWNPLLREVEGLRAGAMKLLSSTISKKAPLSTQHFIEILYRASPKGGDPVTPKTVRQWRERGLLRDNGRNNLSLETAIAVLIMRLAEKEKEKGFLPLASTQSNEPYMYVWRIDEPGKLAVPCGLPLPKDLPRHAFLYSRWQLLSVLHPHEWLPYESGSVRWAYTKEENQQIFWNVTEKDLRVWEAEIEQFSTYLGTSGALDATPIIRQTVANLVLLRLARLALGSTAPA